MVGPGSLFNERNSKCLMNESFSIGLILEDFLVVWLPRNIELTKTFRDLTDMSRSCRIDNTAVLILELGAFLSYDRSVLIRSNHSRIVVNRKDRLGLNF